MFTIVVFEREVIDEGHRCVERVECETDKEVCETMNVFCIDKPEDKWPKEKYIHLIYEDGECVFSDA
jgi:hypothetical protein